MVSSLEDVTAVWLTDYLRKQGYIQNERIIQIEHGKVRKAWSGQLTPLLLTYDVETDAPRHLIYKEWHSTWATVAKHELYFYTDIAPQMTSIRVPHLYYERHDENSACAIYEDFTAEYEVSDRMPIPRVKLVIDDLAKFHADWWDAPRLQDKQFTQAQGGPLFCTHMSMTAVLDAYQDGIQKNREKLLAGFEDASEAWLDAFEWAIEHWHDLVSKRARRKQHVTLIHGDVHLFNLAFHKETDAPLLFDWETYKCGMGASEITYFLHNTIWGQERKQHELDLLRYYHQQLVVYGIQDYSWDALVEDYRLSQVMILLIHLFWQAFVIEQPAEFTQNAIDGFVIWDCQKMIGS